MDPTAEKGMDEVKHLVEQTWGSLWQRFDQRNDDGVDGVVLIRRRGKDTGAMLFVQVKCGKGYLRTTKVRSEHLDIHLGQEYIADHRPRWNRYPGPVVLVYVDPSTDRRHPHAWWTDLRSEESYTPQNRSVVLCRKAHRFGEHSKGHLRRLCGTGPVDRRLPAVKMGHSEVAFFGLSGWLKDYARQYYREWAVSPATERTNLELGVVEVSRAGWRHMCRKDRKREHTVQSWLLLPAAKKVIQEVKEVDALGHVETRWGSNGHRQVKDYCGLRARVQFPHRHESVVQVVLRRVREFNKAEGTPTSRVWFWSVYEPRRGKLT